MHDAIVREVQALAKAADAKAIAGAWLVAIGQKPAFWRAPLPTLAFAARVPTHAYQPFSDSSPSCRECGFDPTAEIVTRDFPRGEVLPGDLTYALAALRRAANEVPPVPTRADAKRLEAILALVGKAPATAREGAINEAIRKAKLVPGNKYDVRSVIEALGSCGIFETPEHPGFTTKWTSFGARQDRPNVRVEADPPIAFWMAGHGVNAKNVKHWFKAHGVTTPASAAPRALPVAKASASIARRDKRSERATELVVGDTLAIKVGSEWRAVRVVDHHQDRGGTFPIVQPVAYRGAKPPTLAALAKRKPTGKRTMIDFWKRDDPAGRWITLGTTPTEHIHEVRITIDSLRREGSLARLFT